MIKLVTIVSRMFLKHKLSLRETELKYPNLSIGKNLKINGRLYCNISATGKVIIGENVVFTSDVKRNLMGLNKNCSIAVGPYAELIIGDHCGFSGTTIVCRNKITIGKYLTCGGNTFIWDTDFHPIQYEDRRKNEIQKIKTLPITIGDDVFIGGNSIILKGVNIADRTVIAAGSVIVKSTKKDEVWGGNPAKFIKLNNDN